MSDGHSYKTDAKEVSNKASYKAPLTRKTRPQTDKFSTLNHTTLNTLVGRQNSIE